MPFYSAFVSFNMYDVSALVLLISFIILLSVSVLFSAAALLIPEIKNAARKNNAIFRLNFEFIKNSLPLSYFNIA